MKRTPLKKGNNTLKQGKGLKKGSNVLRPKGGSTLKSGGKLRNNGPSEAKKEFQKKMREFFEYMWSIRVHYSEVSGTYLGEECKSIFQHHIIPKSTNKDLAFVEANIIFLTPDEHARVENDIYCFEEVNIRRETLKRIYGL